MRHISFGNANQLLNNLLDRLEARPNIARPFSYADEAALPSVEARDRFIETIQAAERLGAVKLDASRSTGETRMRIRLVDADALYRHLGRTPSHQQVGVTLADLYHLPYLPETAVETLDEIASAWARNVRKFGITPHDTTSLRETLSLACGLQERAKDSAAATIDFRSFSRSVGTDSKALDRLIRSVVAIHARLYPHHAMPDGPDSDEFLATLGVTRIPQPFLISGPVAVNNLKLPDLVYYGFPPDQAAAVTLARSVDYVLMIENYTSFMRHARELNGDQSGLILYTAGFPARSHLRQIRRLCREASAPTYHWGDLDAGGVRIFKHLEKALHMEEVHLRPHMMNADLLAEYGVPGSGPPTPSRFEDSGNSMDDLWRALCETGLILEQESLSPQRPL